MKKYRLLITKKAERALLKLHPRDQKKIALQILQLENNPFPQGKKVKKLIQTNNCWRLRWGKIRVIFEFDSAKDTICILDVGYRGSIYQ